MPWPTRNTLLPGCRTYSPDRRGQVRRRSPCPGPRLPQAKNAAGQPPGRPGRLLISCLRGRRSGAEVRDRRGTADALDPDVLDAGELGCDVAGGDDHLRGEGLVVTVTGAVEVCQQHDRVLVGDRGLQRLGRGPGALEGRAWQQGGGVPADALAGQAAGQRALADVAGAPEAARGLGEAGPRDV